MNQHQAKIKSENLTLIKEKLFSGKAALEESDLNYLFKQLEDELNETIRDKLISTDNELVKLWCEVFEVVSAGNFADSLMFSLDKEIFYKFGLFIHEEINVNPANENLVLLIHEYLNIFRTSSLLKKIYKEKKWEALVFNLISSSNYNVSVLFNQRVREYGDKPLFKLIKGNTVDKISWNEVNKNVSKYSHSFYSLIKDEDSNSVKITFLLENSPYMPLLDLACLTTGIVNVMIPANSVTDHIKFMLNQTQSPLLIVHDEKQLAKVKSIKIELIYLKQVILLYGTSAEDWVISFNEFIESGKNITDDDINMLKNNITMNSLATIMYTSGTTGEPKGIMFSQMNIVYKRFCRAMALPEIGDKDRYLSFLPLFHTFGRWLEMMGSIFWGAEYCFMENPAVETMIANMQLVHPTIFISIPKKWMQLYEQVSYKVDIELDSYDDIKSTVKELTGGKLKWGLSAAGYLPSDVFKFFQSYEIELMSGFGMTEATGGVTMTPPSKYKENSLGSTLPGIEIKLGEDSEVLIKGNYVMMGYYKNPVKDTFIDGGWLPTGDIMKMDEDGFIEIIDRKKEIYKNIKGETIAPQKIENFFREFENVKQVFLVGDHKPFNTVLIYPDYEINKSSLKKLNEKQKLEYFSSLIVTVNKFLAPFERILDFRIIERLFSAEHGELTPKGTYKRRVIEQNFDEVIETMYTKNYISIDVNNIEVRVPNWFLREKGCLSRDIIGGKSGIEIPKINALLTIEKLPADSNVFRIGSYNYTINSEYIDMQMLLTNPYYWIGNNELLNFTGKSIFQWYRLQSVHESIRYHSSNRNVIIDPELQKTFNMISLKKEFSLEGIHSADLMLQSNDSEHQTKAVNYLQKILADETNYNYQFALEITSRPNLTESIETRRRMFKAVIVKLSKNSFEKILLQYIGLDHNLLNKETIDFIVNLGRGKELPEVAEGILQLEIEKLENGKSYEVSPVSSLFDLLEKHSLKHPTSFKQIRRFVMRYAVFSSSEKIKQKADTILTNLQQGLRLVLGKNQTVSVDMETGKEYGWDDVLTFDSGIDPEDRLRMRNALIKTSVLREAIFLFSKGFILRLDNILPGGVWISHLETKSYKSIYRVILQTRFQGGYDITLHLAQNLPPSHIKEEIKWLILPATTISGESLLPMFGGYWEDYDLWTEEFVPRESVKRFILKTVKKNEEAKIQRLKYLWTYFVWNAAAAYMQFWKLTNYQIELANPLPENISIPTHDYQTGTILYSVSKRIKSDSISDFFKNFYLLFVKQTVDKYDFLKKKSIWNYIFSGLIEVEGETEGLILLKKFGAELKSLQDFPEKEETGRRLNLFIDKLEKELFIPKPVFFAIKRFHRWLELNVNAAFTAQAEMLYELYETYQLFQLEETHPSTRTIFFLETAFINSDTSFKKSLGEIATKQRNRSVAKEETLNLISRLQMQFELSEKEKFFLARLSYPYLKPTDSATLLRVGSEEEIPSNLVVQLLDDDQNPFLIRNPISPKEISRLHQLFFESNLLVHFRPEHQFLAALSERGFIIGGLYYLRIDDQTARMEKIVVSDRYRRKGISEALMNELFNRLKSSHYKFVTTGFFRPEYFYKFGFTIERKYSGLVKNLAENKENN
ncbi:MAG: GNAT family N-acetyltransferase [Bacteroidetes bacterium]|nr:GNAT family N-acetyltransferase [Bacteroidota bacterium]